MKTTQFYRKHNGVLALSYVTVMLIWLGVIIGEKFMEVKLTMFVIFCKTRGTSFVCWRYF